MSFQNIFFLCFQLLFYIGGPLLVGMGVYYIYLYIRTPRVVAQFPEWVTVDARIRKLFFPGKPGWMNEVILEYEYSYEGQPYKGKRFNLFPNTVFGKESVEKLKRDYPEGAKVQAYINPQKPVEAVLEKEMGRLPLYFLIWGILNIIMGGFMLAVIIMGLLGA